MERPNALVGLKTPSKIRILVVDDEKVNVELLSRYLVKEGFAVDAAGNGEEALRKVSASAPDLILLDIRMPVMDGLTLCRRLRDDLLTRSLPIIFLTACNALEERLSGLGAGVDDYIGKPFHLEEVKARVEGALQRRRWDLWSHPLTRLPGSPAIEEEVRKRIRQGLPFAFAYLDIDNFKAYNDVYGYDEGDRVIKGLAALLIDAIKEDTDRSSFAGHVGGDDFVFMSTQVHMKKALAQLAERFDHERPQYYLPEDLARGAIITKDRRGVERAFSPLTLSIAVVSTETRRILHYARLVEIAAELKQFIKKQDHGGVSRLMWDRRADPALDGTQTDA